MDENDKALPQRRRRWPRLVRRSLLVLLAIVLIFHRPIIFHVGGAIANNYAAKANLKIDCAFEGSIFTGLIIKNLHVVPVGPTIVESIDVDYIRADYSLIDLLRHGATEVLKNAEVRTARIVLNPAKASLKPKVPRPNERITLFAVFPERLRLSDINLRVRSTTEKQDFVLEHFNVDFDPKNPGKLHLATLQIPNAPPWKNISAQTSYTNKNLILSGLVLDADNQFRLIAVDASRIGTKSLKIVLDATLAHGTVTGSVALRETPHSLDTKLRLVAENVSLDTLRGYLGKPPEFLAGDVQRLAIESSGAIDSPRTWDVKLEAKVNNLRQGNFSFDHCVANVTAHGGVATLNSGEATQRTEQDRDERNGGAGLSETKSCSIRQAVTGFTFSIAAWIGSIPSGTTTSFSAFTAQTSRHVPKLCGKITSAPIWISRTADPSSTTVPAPSIPGVAGNAGRIGYFPSIAFRSAGLIGAAAIFTTTSSGAGSGQGCSTIRSTSAGSPCVS